MPSLSETRIYVDEKDDDAKKRPLSEGDIPAKWYLRKGGQVHYCRGRTCKVAKRAEEMQEHLSKNEFNNGDECP